MRKHKTHLVDFETARRAWIRAHGSEEAMAMKSKEEFGIHDRILGGFVEKGGNSFMLLG